MSHPRRIRHITLDIAIKQKKAPLRAPQSNRNQSQVYVSSWGGDTRNTTLVADSLLDFLLMSIVFMSSIELRKPTGEIFKVSAY